MIMRGLGMVVILALLGGCAPYDLVTLERRDLGGFSVEPQIEWSSLENGGIEIWTVHGTGLEAVYFADGIADGEPLFEQRFGESDKPLPRFRSPMNANEAMEFVVDTLAISGAGEIRTSALRPAEFGAHAGFRFDLGYRDASGLEGRGLALGAVIDGRLYLLLYLAAAEHYFAAYGGPVERMIDSLETP